ncbi:MAG: EamA family transporter [Opitutus sp.]|nr:EamA family transporter [Opitutus sp.]
MPFLIVVSLLWAFSFGLTKGKLAGLDATFISTVRLGLALAVFLPFLRTRGLTVRTACILAAIGAVQFGLMYLAFNESYRYLQAYEVVLFTITTPVFVTLFADALDQRLHRTALAAALLAVLGAAVMVVKSPDVRVTLTGLGLVQLSNGAFAVGQVLYRRLRARQPDLRDREVFGLLYAGAFAIALGAMLLRSGGMTLTRDPVQLGTLVYLGVIASGLGFFLWNVGATRVNAGTLAVMNNAKVPLGVACSLLFFGERASNPWLLLVSFALMAGAVWLAGRKPPSRNTRH